MVSQVGSLGYTLMGKTADLTVVQKTIIDTLHKEGKPQTFIAKEAGCSQSAVSKHVNRKLSGRKKCRRKRCTTNRENRSLNKLEFSIKPIKKTFLVNCWPSGKYVNLLYMYSILGRGSFCFNYCLNSAWHGGDQFVALLRWYGSPGFFDSGFQLICIFWS